MSTKANQWQKLVIISKSIMYSLYFCLIVFWRTMWGRCTREGVDILEHDWAEKVLSAIKVSYHIHNPHNVQLSPNKPYVIMSNHASHYDIPLIIAAFPGSIRMIAKKELFKIPIWGPALKTAEFVSIDRDNRRQAWHDLNYAKEKLLSGITLWIAPEGTRSRTGELSPFKKGGFMLAMHAGATIIPVALENTQQILPTKTLDFHMDVEVNVYIGEPVDVASLSKKDYPALMQTVGMEIKRLLMK